MQLQSKQGKGDWADTQPAFVTRERTLHCLLRKASLSLCIVPACFVWDAGQMQETHRCGLDDIFLCFLALLCCAQKGLEYVRLLCISLLQPSRELYS